MNHNPANREDTAAVVSGSDVFDSSDTSSESEFESESERNETPNTNTNKYGISKIDELYNPNGDEEDEAYVYKHLRGGVEERVNIAIPNKSKNTTSNVNVNPADNTTQSQPPQPQPSCQRKKCMNK